MDKKFDGGPVMKEIKTFLEDNFATNDKSELSKPSHGMILVEFTFLLKFNKFDLYIDIIF